MSLAHEIVIDGDLGGCGKGEVGDIRTYVPSVWSGLIEMFDIRSVLDIGCGYGYAVRWFHEHGVAALGIEGSAKVAHEAVVSGVICHDYTTGSVGPEDLGGADLCWCSEFAEHVGQQFEANWIADAKRCRILALTAAVPGQGGHHHVNEQPPAYWIERLGREGFKLHKTATDWLREVAADAHPYSYFSFQGLVFTRHVQ